MKLFGHVRSGAEVSDGPARFWTFVIDCRLASLGSRLSGIGRFVSCFAQALTEQLNQQPQWKGSRILLVSRTAPEPWMISLAKEYPHVVGFESWNPGSRWARLRVPLFAWASFMFSTYQKKFGKKFIWIAPGNIDRPLVPSWGANRKREQIVQIIHDTIPLLKHKGTGFLFKMQYRLLMRQALLRLPNIFTCSQTSANHLRSLFPKRKDSISIVPYGLEQRFGSRTLRATEVEKKQLKENFLSKVMGSLPPAETKYLKKARWILGVGRNEQYKNWEFAQDVVKLLRQKNPNEEFVWIHVGANFEKVTKKSNTVRKVPKTEDHGKNEAIGVFCWGTECNIGLSSLPDMELVDLYYASDLLIHPSSEEGFGFPPLEASLCGLPVLYLESTAIKEHFPRGLLPSFFWNGLPNLKTDSWANAAQEALFSSSCAEFLNGIGKFEKSRDFFDHVSRESTFLWKNTATRFLGQIALPD